VQRLNERIGLPAGLRAMGIGAETDAAVVDNALQDHCHATNPRPATREDYHRLLEASA
jgi:alcohol dehydrogenase class IV